MPAKRGATAPTTVAPDDDEIIFDDDEVEVPSGTEDGDLTELIDAIKHYREVDARYRLVYDEMMAARVRLGAAKDAAGISRSAGFIE